MAVSPLCVGMVSEPDTVLAAWDAGINFFFLSADMHWPAYEGLREGLRRLAKARPAALDEAVIACTTYLTQTEFMVAPFVEALEAVAPFRRFDIAVAGGSYLPDVEKRLAALRDNVKEGVAGVRCIGLSAHDRAAAVSVVNGDQAELVFVRYNAKHPGARLDLFPQLKASRSTRVFNFKSTSPYRPPETFHQLGVDREMWLPLRTDYYRFVLARPEIDGILISVKSPLELEGVVTAHAQGPLDPDEENHLLGLAKLQLDATDPKTR